MRARAPRRRGRTSRPRAGGTCAPDPIASAAGRIRPSTTACRRDSWSRRRAVRTRRPDARGARASLWHRALHLVVQLGEAGADLSDRDQPKRRTDYRARQERLPRAEGDGPDLHEQLVEQAGVVELSDEITAADQPDVLATGGLGHGAVHGPDVAAREADVGAGDARQRPGGEHPGRLLVRPWPWLIGFGSNDVLQHPLVRGRPHREGADVLDERRVARVVDVTERKQPVEGIARTGDEAVEAAGGVVLGFHFRGCGNRDGPNRSTRRTRRLQVEYAEDHDRPPR